MERASAYLFPCMLHKSKKDRFMLLYAAGRTFPFKLLTPSWRTAMHDCVASDAPGQITKRFLAGLGIDDIGIEQLIQARQHAARCIGALGLGYGLKIH
jgi:hypothetical protein